MMRVLTRFLGDRSGAVALEYVFVAGLIACAIIVSVRALGSNLANVFAMLAVRVT